MVRDPEFVRLSRTGASVSGFSASSGLFTSIPFEYHSRRPFRERTLATMWKYATFQAARLATVLLGMHFGRRGFSRRLS
jgi:hypothetical protein